MPGTDQTLIDGLSCRSSAATACSARSWSRTTSAKTPSASPRCACCTTSLEMGVALENARLFDETQRLLKETEQRAAELAVINSIQQGIAAELDFQAIIDLVGDKLREVFETGDIGIRWSTRRPAWSTSSTSSSTAQRLNMPPRHAPTRRSRRHGCARRAQPDRLQHARRAGGRRHRRRCRGTDHAPLVVCVPIVGSDRLTGLASAREPRARARVRRVRSAPAVDGRGEHGRGAGERAPVRRDAAPAEGNRAARRRAGGDQQHPAGHRRVARLPGHRRPGRRQAARGVRHRRHRHPLVSTRARTCPLPLRVRARRSALHVDPMRRSRGGHSDAADARAARLQHGRREDRGGQRRHARHRPEPVRS